VTTARGGDLYEYQQEFQSNFDFVPLALFVSLVILHAAVLYFYNFFNRFYLIRAVF
jgi:hypothetical protein